MRDDALHVPRDQRLVAVGERLDARARRLQLDRAMRTGFGEHDRDRAAGAQVAYEVGHAFGVDEHFDRAQIGADADLAVFDLKNEREVTLEDQYKVEWTLYEGRKAVWPDKVFVRGKKVVDGGKVVGERGYGELCSPVSGSVGS